MAKYETLVIIIKCVPSSVDCSVGSMLVLQVELWALLWVKPYQAPEIQHLLAEKRHTQDAFRELVL